MSPLKRDAANLLISLDFAGAGDWLGRWRGGSDGGIERRRWRWQGWAWATGGGSVICIQLPTQIWKNAFLTYSLHRWCNKINNITTPPVLSTMSNIVNNEKH
jgi:hypothetical protein